jgi:hypothetical protein
VGGGWIFESVRVKSRLGGSARYLVICVTELVGVGTGI